MALQNDFVDDNKGLTIANAYVKIGNFNGNKDNVRFDIEVFVNSQARLAGKQPIGLFMFEIPYQDSMSIASLYTYLKTLPEFANAIDV